MNLNNVKLNSHKNHNPSCDILCYQLDKDTTVTYGVYVKRHVRKTVHKSPRGSYLGGGMYGINKGTEFMEVYVGENYNVGSTKRSYSRCYYYGPDKMPERHFKLWLELKQLYKEKYK